MYADASIRTSFLIVLLAGAAGIANAQAPAAQDAPAAVVTEPAAQAVTPDAPVPAAPVAPAAPPAGAIPETTPATGVPVDTTQIVGAVPELVQIKPAFQYDASLPDPFLPYREPVIKCPEPGEYLPPGTVIPEECGEEMKEPLELFELKDLKVLGIIWGIRDSRAKLKDPQNNYWTVRVGQKIGKHRGRIRAIREGEIEVEERYWDENLRAYQRVTTIMSM
ncbi:MAG: pilus assembly protein PilP [Deltaproteobacteria bacterium]|nr:pilus assembly protein PilP [Deltaproteobacteria bacterium]